MTGVRIGGRIPAMRARTAGLLAASAMALAGCYESRVPLHAAADGVRMPAWSDTQPGSAPHCRRPRPTVQSGLFENREVCLFRFAADIETPSLNATWQADTDEWLIARVQGGGRRPTADGGYHEMGYGYAVISRESLRAAQSFEEAGNASWSGITGGTSRGLMNLLLRSGEAIFVPGNGLGAGIEFRTRRALETALLDVVEVANRTTWEAAQGRGVCDTLGHQAGMPVDRASIGC